VNSDPLLPNSSRQIDERANVQGYSRLNGQIPFNPTPELVSRRNR
jgi:hypothetical protein